MCSPSTPEGRSSSGGTSTLRRHKTLPGPLRSFPTRRRFQDVQTAVASSTMRLSKSNPYVGWFRHAPPSLRHLTAEAAEWLQKNTFTRNNCCAPFLRRSSSTPFTTSTKPFQLLYCYREGEHSFAVYRAWQMHPMMRDNDFTAGMLLGGTTVGQAGDLDGIKNKKNKNGTNVLSQVAYWLLDASVFIENPPSLQEIDGTTTMTATEKKCPSSSTGSCKSAAADSMSSDDDDDEDSDELTIESRDEVGPCANSRRRQHQRPTSVANHDDSSVDDRLDYNITQMDIVRMNRIASRHLDVESIFSLPTVTYQLPPSPASPNSNNSSSSINHKDDGDNSFSWMLVHSDSEASEAGEGCGTARLYEGCVICLEGFTTGDRLRILPCKHKFHISCIDKWLSGASSDVYCNTSGCPTCKASPTTFGNNNNNSECGMAVPGWAFARIGDALIRESQHL